MKITVIDTETTGLDLFKHEIIQIGLIELEVDDSGNHKIIAEHEFKIKPHNIEDAQPEALRINGYLEEDWKNAVAFQDILPLLENLWRGSDLLLGQNLIFDLKFIAKEYFRLDMDVPAYPNYIDTKHMGTALVNEGMIKSSSMDKMCEHFKIKFKGRAHTALTDCQRTVTMWQLLLKYTNAEMFSFKDPYDPYAKSNSNA